MRLWIDKPELGGGTAAWYKYIWKRIDNNKNFLGTITGPTGSGKSYSALSLMEILNPDKTPEELIKNVCFDAHEFMSRINSKEMYQGCTLLWDESGVGLSSKNWQSLANKSINYLLQTFRNMNLIVLFTLPYFTFLDNSSRKLMHSLMQTIKVDRGTNTTLIKPFVLSTSQQTGKQYNPYLKVRSPNGGLLKVKSIRLPKPSARLLELYEEKKSIFTKKLNEDIEKKLDTAKKKENKTIDPLTARQRQVADLNDSGYTNQEIAVSLGISLSSVYDLINSIKMKGLTLKNNKKPIVNKGFAAFRPISPPLKSNIDIDEEIVN